MVCGLSCMAETIMITDNEFKRRLILGELSRRGLRCDRQGNGWRVYGRGVDILTADIANVDVKALIPARWSERGQIGAD